MRNNGLRLDEIVSGDELALVCKGPVLVTWILDTSTLNSYVETNEGWEALECRTDYGISGIETALASAKVWIAYEYAEASNYEAPANWKR